MYTQTNIKSTTSVLCIILIGVSFVVTSVFYILCSPLNCNGIVCEHKYCLLLNEMYISNSDL